MNITLHVWRQKNAKSEGKLIKYAVNNASPDMSFLEMLDIVNEELIVAGEEPIAFDHDCREGICGSCGVVINGIPHGPQRGTTACQLHMRMFKDGDEIYVEPWRAKAFPVIKDLIVDRGSFDRIVQAGGFISAATGTAPDGNTIPVSKESSDRSMDAAACIGCGACVAVCPNASAMLFTASKAAHLNLLPQGQPERYRRVVRMVEQMEEEGFGGCTNIGECSAVCPKEISMDVIALLNRDLLTAAIKGTK